MLPVIQYRRALHQIPELDDQLPETTAFVRRRLDGLAPFSPIPGSVCAFLDAGKPETAAFRADLDALPVTERTGLPYASPAATMATPPFSWPWRTLPPPIERSCPETSSSSSSPPRRPPAERSASVPPVFWNSTGRPASSAFTSGPAWRQAASSPVPVP